MWKLTIAKPESGMKALKRVRPTNSRHTFVMYLETQQDGNIVHCKLGDLRY